MSVLKITKENYETEVLKSDKLVLIDFYADWCGPCKMMSPIIDEIAEEVGDKIKVGKINVDENQELAMEYEVMSSMEKGLRIMKVSSIFKNIFIIFAYLLVIRKEIQFFYKSLDEYILFYSYAKLVC